MLNYNIDFCNGAKIKIEHNNPDLNYQVEFIDYNTGKLAYKTTIKRGSWAKTNEIYYKKWKIKVSINGNTVLEHILNLKGKIVVVRFHSKSLGDTLAWMPYLEEFRKKHDCILYCASFNNELFEYNNINFIPTGKNVKNTYAEYHLGWFNPQKYKNPNNYRNIPLQKTASDILDLEFKEIKPIIKQRQIHKKPTEYRYVCLSEYSTANCKHWHYPVTNSNKGWQILVDWLNYNGYKVMVISKQHTSLKNVIDRTGNFPLDFRIYELQNCEFFIGIGSGLSWLAWSLNKKVVMISGFSDPLCEFKNNNIRIINKNVCNGCFNKFEFNRGDWNWCPVHKNTNRQFECTKNITPKYVTNKIIESRLVKDKGGFDFNEYVKDMNISNEQIDIYYEDNKVKLKYKENEPLKDIHVDIIDDNNNIIRCLRNIELNKKHIIWTSFNENIKTNKFIIDIFNDKKKLLRKNIIIKQ